MSKSYRMHITIRGALPAKHAAIYAALAAEGFSEDKARLGDVIIELSGVAGLPGGEGIDGAVDRMAKAIWAANGEHCSIKMIPTPINVYVKTEAEYTQLAADEPGLNLKPIAEVVG